MVALVPPEKLSHVWPEVEAWIARAVKVNQGDENLLDVLIAIARGHYMLWYAPDQYAVVAQIQHFPRQRVAVILYCGGSGLTDMRAAFAEAKRWCIEHGINAIRTWGRPGWSRVLGLEEVGVISQVTLQ